MKEKIKNLIKKEWRLPYSQRVSRVISAFSLTEKVIFFSLATIFVISGISLLSRVSKSFMVEVPDYGGTLNEGVVGSPRFVNPLLAVSDTDRDLSALIYSGLLKMEGDGNIVPDLAESYTVSDDELTYVFTLKDNTYFHDGVKVTADDVLYTIETIKNPILKSPRKTNWDGVEIKKIDNKTIIFTLKQPYSPFIKIATLGILPMHIWKSASIEELPFSQFNIKPVGTGPYKIGSITYTSSGLPSEYHLISNKKYILGQPFVTNLTIKAYQNKTDMITAYKNSDIESMYGISPKQLPDIEVAQDEILLSPLPRVFGVFWNQNVAPVFANKEVREALNMATDRAELVETILDGYGQPIYSPVPPKTVGEIKNEDASVTDDILAKAQAILTKKGWKQNSQGIFEKTTAGAKKGDKKTTTTLTFSISTGDAPDLKESAYLLQKQWQKLGASVDVKVFEINDLNQNIIRSRKYDALLFGEVTGRDFDLYPFWHSSQRLDPGLNIALYTNIKADKLLENIRKTSDPKKQADYFNQFSKEIKNDTPAVFTYSPYFIYIVPKKVQNVKMGILTTPSERFADVNKWYIETNNVWKIFINN